MGPTTAVALPHRTVMTIRPIQLGAGDAAAEGGGGIVAQAQAVQRPAQQQSGDPRHHYRQQDNFQRLQGADIQRTGLPEA